MEACPCCKHKTLRERGQFDICPVCFWEDDGNNEPEGDPGPNGVTLRVARENFASIGVCEEPFEHCVRKPQPEEMP